MHRDAPESFDLVPLVSRPAAIVGSAFLGRVAERGNVGSIAIDLGSPFCAGRWPCRMAPSLLPPVSLVWLPVGAAGIENSARFDSTVGPWLASHPLVAVDVD